jgi:trans-aconitate methyltransferase
MLYSLVDSLGKKYLSKSKCIVELGCGTGHNLWRMKAINPKALLIGADWVKSSNKMVEAQGFDSMHLDFFNPPSVPLAPGHAYYSVAALEQIGTDYEKLVAWLLKGKPETVVHIEPIPELLDSTKLLDYLSIQYMHKRKYLRGYLTYLESLEKKGKIKIIEARRSGIGSMFIDGYSVIVWKPL